MYLHPGEFVDAARALYEGSGEPHTKRGILELVQQTRGLLVQDAHLTAAWPNFEWDRFLAIAEGLSR